MTGINKTTISWAVVQRNINALAKTMKKLKYEKYDAVVAVGRGGMVPARLLAEKFNVQEMYIINATAYDDLDKFTEVKVGNIKIAKHVKKILVVDDCIFTGSTLDTVMEKIAENEHITDIVNVVLYKNKNLKTMMTNTFYAEEYDGNTTWLVFPWEDKGKIK